MHAIVVVATEPAEGRQTEQEVPSRGEHTRAFFEGVYVIVDRAVVDDLKASHEVKTGISKRHVGNARLKQRECAGGMTEGVARKIEAEWGAVALEPRQIATGTAPGIEDAPWLWCGWELAEPGISDGAHAGVPPVLLFNLSENLVFAGFHAEYSFSVWQMHGACYQWY